MSKRNRHKTSTWVNEVNSIKCPNKKCKGRLIHCWSIYAPRGPVQEELECSECSTVKREQWRIKRARFNR